MRGCVSTLTGNKRFANALATCTRSDTFHLCRPARCRLWLTQPTARPGRAACEEAEAAGGLLGTHRFGLRVMRAEEADDASPAAHVQDHLAPEGLSVLQDHVVVLSCPRLVRQHL